MNCFFVFYFFLRYGINSGVALPTIYRFSKVKTCRRISMIVVCGK